MASVLNILHLEDNVADATLLEELLKAQGIPCAITCVRSRPEFESALRHGDVDLVISDYSLPQFDGLSALRIVRERFPDLPFIFVSGTIGEEVAVRSLKEGATDYILKENISRLCAAVERAAGEAEKLRAKRRIEEELRRSHELFRHITEDVDDLIAVLDPTGKRVFSNPAYKKLLGETHNLLGSDSFADVHPADRDRIQKIFASTLATGQGQRTEYRLQLKDGSVRFIESQGSAMRDERGKIANIIVVSRDITERRRSEEQIREQAALLDRAQDAICLNDMNQTILYWNEGAERLYGYSAQEVTGKNANDLLFQGDSTIPRNALKRLIRDGEWQGEMTQITKAGRRITVESRWTLMLDAQHQPRSILIINTDVTEKKQIEAQLLRTQRVESIGALAGGIAHDLNNAIAPILIATELLKKEITDPEAVKLVELIEASSRRSRDMVRQILSFSRGVVGERSGLNLKAVVSEIVKLMSETFPSAVAIESRVDPDVHMIIGDATQLHQVLLNLCVNARDAMTSGGKLSIRVGNVSATRKHPLPRPHVRIEVSDTGHGIPAELIDKIFEPFFTTKMSGAGTGLGLSTVASIVKAHGGLLEVESRVGQGTTFEIYLPAATEETAAPVAPKKTAAQGHGESILVVDDELAILEMTKLLLEAFNYVALTAKDGREALEIYREKGGEIKAVITDTMMPGMTGPELAEALRKINPEIRIIVVSGLGSRPAGVEAKKQDAFLTKPYGTDELLLTLQDLIHR